MERMFARVEVVENDFDNIVFGEHKGVCVAAVNFGGCSNGARGDCSVKGGNERLNVGYIVDECALEKRLACKLNAMTLSRLQRVTH